MDTSPLAHEDTDSQDVRTTTQPWTIDHSVHLFAQTESRPGPVTDEGEQWMERQHTGKVNVVCACGYTSGLIDGAEAEELVETLATEHAPRPIQKARSEA